MFRFIKQMTLGLFLIPLGHAQMATAHGVGNGGDHIRATFMSMGNAVIQFLDESDAGMQLKSQHQLDSTALAATLDINVISVSEGQLIDSSGSSVDAIGTRGKIILSKDRWLEHFEKDHDVYFLVFHEMLRAVEINDDNYVISKALSPFPVSRKIITRMASIYPILGQTSLDSIINTNKILIEGSGCSQEQGDTFSDIDLERNMLSVSLRKFQIPLKETLSGRKTCAIVIPFKAPVGKKLVVTQLDFSAKVALSANARASIATDAVFGASGIAPKTKDFTAVAPTQGRIFLRSNAGVSSPCDGSAGLLKIRTSANLQKPQQATELNLLTSDNAIVSFAIEDCKSK